jgi:hypothetical protein
MWYLHGKQQGIASLQLVSSPSNLRHEDAFEDIELLISLMVYMQRRPLIRGARILTRR